MRTTWYSGLLAAAAMSFAACSDDASSSGPSAGADDAGGLDGSAKPGDGEDASPSETSTSGGDAGADARADSGEVSNFPNKGTGGSTATCSPNPCTPGQSVGRSVMADDGSGYMVNFPYTITRPVGLTNASTNKAPLMIDIFGDSSTSFAAANKYVYVFIPQPPSCPASVPNCGYATRAINPNAANIGLMNSCGPPAPGQPYGSGTGPCDMKHEVKAILDAVLASDNIDTDKIFVGGASKGGYATLDAVCDPLTSHYFRGAAIISANVIGSKVPGPAIADVNSSKMLCPALTVPPVNKDISLLFIHGTKDGAVVDQGKVVSWTDGTSSWYYDQHQGLLNGANALLGCPGTGTMIGFGTGNANVRESWTCGVPNRITQLDTITNGGHTCSAMDGVNGYDCRTEYWSFFTSH